MATNDITFGPGSQNGSDLTATNQAKPTFQIEMSDGNKSSYTAAIDGTAIGTFTSDTWGKTLITAPTALTDGAHTLTVHETTPHVQDLVPFTFKVDTVAPPAIP